MPAVPGSTKAQTKMELNDEETSLMLNVVKQLTEERNKALKETKQPSRLDEPTVLD